MDGSIADDSLQYECFKKWHWEWSKYYFYNKHYNKVLIIFIAIKSLVKFSIKSFIFYFLDKNKYHVYKSRIKGILSYYTKTKKLSL